MNPWADDYPDLFDSDDRPELPRFAHELERSQPRRMPEAERRRVRLIIEDAARAEWERMAHRQSLPTRWFSRRFSTPFAMASVVLAILVLTLGAAIATSSVIDLGKPTNAGPSNPYFPVGGFHRAVARLHPARKPEFLWIGTAWGGDAWSAAERWPVVKALEQFGRLAGLTAAGQPCWTEPGSNDPPLCELPTFDWTHLRYASKYISFIHKDLIDARGRVFQRLSPDEQRLANRYLRNRPGPSLQALNASIYDPNTIRANAGRQFPLLIVGDYVQTVPQTPLVGDFDQGRIPVVPGSSFSHGLTTTVYYQALTFGQAQRALASGIAPTAAGGSGQAPLRYGSLVPDVNGEANIITAVICHADDERPSSVCHRPVIARILKHIK